MTNKFAEAWKGHQERTFTENGAVTLSTSTDSNVDLFFKIGAMRGAPVERLHAAFGKAFGENPYIATRILLWARDVRGGAGERKIFRDLLLWLEQHDQNVLRLVLPKIPELGRWDDMLVFKTPEFKKLAYDAFEAALRAKDGLAAKWAPRKGPIANEMRKHFGLTPKQYRKVLVALTNVVEQKMCARDWESINYQHVPSLAQARYSKAFLRHDEARYREFGAKAREYAEAVASGDTEKIKSIEKVTINAGAVYPYDVIKTHLQGIFGYSYASADQQSVDTVRAQWLSLPNYVGDQSTLVMADFSGSMWSQIAGNLRCIDVAASLALYMASKNTGAFHNMFMSFTDIPTLVHLKGEDVVSHIEQLKDVRIGYSTNLAKGFSKLLDFAKVNSVPQSDMPKNIVVVSDMEFDAFNPGQTAFENIKDQFARAGYTAPTLIWWNVQSRSDKNVPVKAHETGTALVSGFSPSIAKSIMSGQGVTPVEMMMKVIMDSRYDLDMVKAA